MTSRAHKEPARQLISGNTTFENLLLHTPHAVLCTDLCPWLTTDVAAAMGQLSCFHQPRADVLSVARGVSFYAERAPCATCGRLSQRYPYCAACFSTMFGSPLDDNVVRNTGMEHILQDLHCWALELLCILPPVTWCFDLLQALRTPVRAVRHTDVPVTHHTSQRLSVAIHLQHGHLGIASQTSPSHTMVLWLTPDVAGACTWLFNESEMGDVFLSPETIDDALARLCVFHMGDTPVLHGRLCTVHKLDNRHVAFQSAFHYAELMD